MTSFAKLVLFYLERALWIQFEAHCAQPMKHKQNSAESPSGALPGDYVTARDKANQVIFVPADNTSNQKLYYIHLRQQILPFWHSFCATADNEIGNELLELIKEVKEKAR